MVKITHNNNRHDFHGYVSEYITIGAVANRQKMMILAYISTHQHQDNGKKLKLFQKYGATSNTAQTHQKLQIRPEYEVVHVFWCNSHASGKFNLVVLEAWPEKVVPSSIRRCTILLLNCQY